MNKENKNVKNSDALKGFLFRAYHACSFKTTRVEDPEQKRLRMTPYFNFPLMGKSSSPWRERMPVGQVRRAGFTLIELLVVVLIIAILAAVALPQYQKAVKKARAVEAITNLKAILRAQHAFYLANGSYTNDLTALDIKFPSGYYRYFCIGNRADCYAVPVDGSGPDFERSGKYTWCRGTAQQCKPFSQIQDTRFQEGGYWLMD